VDAWRNLEEDAGKLAKRLSGKEAATPSRAWQVLSEAKPETILFLDATAKQQSVSQKIKNFFGKWRQLRQKLPLPEMAELRITPQLADYSKIEQETFLLLLDGKLRSRTEILKFLKPYSPPPPPPPPPPPRKARAAKAHAAAPAPAAAVSPAGKKGKGKGKAAAETVEKPAEKPPEKKAEKLAEKPPAKTSKERPVPARKPVPAKKPAKKTAGKKK
jgi:hypothetical protein